METYTPEATLKSSFLSPYPISPNNAQTDAIEQKMVCSTSGFEDTNVPAIASFPIFEGKKGTSKEMICKTVKQHL